MADTAIVAEGPGQRFGPVLALDGVDLELRAGGVLGLLGEQPGYWIVTFISVGAVAGLASCPTHASAARHGVTSRTPLITHGSAFGALYPVLPAEFPESAVVNAEMVRDLVDDGTADLVGDLLLGMALRADRLVVDGDAIGQHARVLRRAAGERDALIQPEQAGRPHAILDRHHDIAHLLAELLGQPVQGRDDHFFETAGLYLDHLPMIHPRTARRQQKPGLTGPSPIMLNLSQTLKHPAPRAASRAPNP
jgi:hypothetical protein